MYVNNLPLLTVPPAARFSDIEKKVWDELTDADGLTLEDIKNFDSSLDESLSWGPSTFVGSTETYRDAAYDLQALVSLRCGDKSIGARDRERTPAVARLNLAFPELMKYFDLKTWLGAVMDRCAQLIDENCGLFSHYFNSNCSKNYGSPEHRQCIATLEYYFMSAGKQCLPNFHAEQNMKEKIMRVRDQLSWVPQTEELREALSKYTY